MSEIGNNLASKFPGLCEDIKEGGGFLVKSSYKKPNKTFLME